MKYTLKQGDNVATLKEYPDNHFDSIVTDPPYGIEFLGKDWDKNTGVIETWEECFRVLKPGGHILAFSAARTYHNLATNIESVGFEIRDQLMWLYGSGFPKAHDIGKSLDKRELENDWHGWKTALKPAHEPIVMARKPFKGSCIDNVLEHGVGAMNIDATRIDYESDYDAKHQADISRGQANATNGTNFFGSGTSISNDLGQGRYPSNVIGEIPDYQQFFYSPKVSRKERHIGYEQLPDSKKRKHKGDAFIGEKGKRGELSVYDDKKNKRPRGEAFGDGNLLTDSTKSLGNNHPTVKPVELMKYLIKLVTPAGGKVLDPFNGSGSTGMAAVELDYDYTGCELDPEYIEISTKRIEGWYEHTRPDTNFDNLFVDK